MRHRLGFGLGLGTTNPWSPILLSNLKLWLRSDLGISLSGSNITAWTDKSGTSQPITFVGSGSAVYTTIDPIFNGRPSVSLGISGATQVSINAASLSLSQPDTIYWVGCPTVAVVNGGFFYDGNTTRQALFVNSSGGAVAYYAGTVVTGSFSCSLNAPFVSCAVFDGTAHALYINNSQTPVASSSPGSNGINDFRLNDHLNQNQKVTETVIVTGAHDAPTRHQVFSYLGAMYNIAIS